MSVVLVVLPMIMFLQNALVVIIVVIILDLHIHEPLVLALPIGHALTEIVGLAGGVVAVADLKAEQ